MTATGSFKSDKRISEFIDINYGSIPGIVVFDADRQPVSVKLKATGVLEWLEHQPMQFPDSLTLANKANVYEQ